jgi:hypothetical protein
MLEARKALYRAHASGLRGSRWSFRARRAADVAALLRRPCRSPADELGWVAHRDISTRHESATSWRRQFLQPDAGTA